jgi:hypothetical protein
MTPQMHAELEALCLLFHSGEISEEEWALLQIHMAYCDGCHQAFLQYHRPWRPSTSSRHNLRFFLGLSEIASRQTIRPNLQGWQEGTKPGVAGASRVEFRHAQHAHKNVAVTKPVPVFLKATASRVFRSMRVNSSLRAPQTRE